MVAIGSYDRCQTVGWAETASSSKPNTGGALRQDLLGLATLSPTYGGPS